MSRFDQAQADLMRWRGYSRGFVHAYGISAELGSALTAVDAAFKSEVLEFRIRRALHAQANGEFGAEYRDIDDHVALQDTPTGRHLLDFDWWLTEATLRSVHSGIDAVAQVLNLSLGLGVNTDAYGFPKEVAAAVVRRDDLVELKQALAALKKSPHARNVAAFVNHVKHAGFPGRVQWDGNSIYETRRHTSVEEFQYLRQAYGPWDADDFSVMIDGLRQLLLDIVKTVVSWQEEPPPSGRLALDPEEPLI